MASQPAPFTELLSAAWVQVRARSSVLIPGFIIFGVVFTLRLAIPQILEKRPDATGLLMIVSIIASLLSVFAYPFFLISIIQNDSSAGEIFKKALKKFLPFLGLSFLTALYTMGWLILVGVLIAGAGPALNMPTLVFIGILVMLAGFVATILYGPCYILAPVLWIAEGKTVIQSLHRSYEVTSGYWGKIFGNMVLLGLMFMVIIIAVSIFSVIITGITGAVAGTAVGALIGGAITGIIALFYNVFSIAFLFKLTATIIAHPRTAVKKKK